MPPQIEAAAVKGIRSAGLRGVGEVVRQIDHAEPYPAVDTGAMRQAVLSEPIVGGAMLSVGTPEAPWMEFGTRPHMPPLGPILTWVQRKFGLATQRRGKRAQGKRGSKERKQGPAIPKHIRAARRFDRASKMQNDAAQAYLIANKVRWKIFRYGTAPRGYFAKAMVTIRSKYMPQEIRHELKALERRL